MLVETYSRSVADTLGDRAHLVRQLWQFCRRQIPDLVLARAEGVTTLHRPSTSFSSSLARPAITTGLSSFLSHPGRVAATQASYKRRGTWPTPSGSEDSIL